MSPSAVAPREPLVPLTRDSAEQRVLCCRSRASAAARTISLVSRESGRAGEVGVDRRRNLSRNIGLIVRGAGSLLSSGLMPNV